MIERLSSQAQGLPAIVPTWVYLAAGEEVQDNPLLVWPWHEHLRRECYRHHAAGIVPTSADRTSIIPIYRSLRASRRCGAVLLIIVPSAAGARSAIQLSCGKG